MRSAEHGQAKGQARELAKAGMPAAFVTLKKRQPVTVWCRI